VQVLTVAPAFRPHCSLPCCIRDRCPPRSQANAAATSQAAQSAPTHLPHQSLPLPRQEYTPPGACPASPAASDADTSSAFGDALLETLSAGWSGSPAAAVGPGPAAPPSFASTFGAPAVVHSAQRRRAPLSMDAVRAALEEVCASAVSDVGDLLCCPITFVRGPHCSPRALCMRAVFATDRESLTIYRTVLALASTHDYRRGAHSSPAGMCDPAFTAIHIQWRSCCVQAVMRDPVIAADGYTCA